MNYKITRPLLFRGGIGTFDTFFDTKKYQSMEAAIKQNDVVVVDFVLDDAGIFYFQAYHIQAPDAKKRLRLDIQDFRFGIDAIDDSRGAELAVSLFLKQKK